MPAALLLLAAVATAPPANLLLVTIDTLRADHLHAYGYAIETPATDALARTGVVAEDATVQVPQTRPSHACLLTGRSEEHTSELQSPYDIVCRLLLEKKHPPWEQYKVRYEVHLD